MTSVLPYVQDLVTSGGSDASDAARRARSLAQLPVVSRHPLLNYSRSLGMSEHGEAS